jgi:hypothetical protein
VFLRLSLLGPIETPYGCEPHNPIWGRATLLRPSYENHPWWCRNINLLTISYAFQPRLRIRLTLGRLTLPRNPWAYGERVFHPFYRYSSLHYLFQALHQSLQSGFTALGMLAYRSKSPKTSRTRSFGVMLKPRYIFGAGSLDQ